MGSEWLVLEDALTEVVDIQRGEVRQSKCRGLGPGLVTALDVQDHSMKTVELKTQKAEMVISSKTEVYYQT